jgi:hypothetical protein
MSAVHVLNDNQGFVMALLTAALVLAAFLSFKTAADQRHDAVRPVLTLEASAGLDGRSTTVSFTAQVVNRGSGPALDVVATYPNGYHLDHEGFSFEEIPPSFAVIGPGQRFLLMVNTDDIACVDRFEMAGGVGQVRLVYRDFSGAKFESVVDVLCQGLPFPHAKSDCARYVHFGPMTIRKISKYD